MECSKQAMMASCLLLRVVYVVIALLNNNNFVQSFNQCKTHTDCTRYGIHFPYCCGGSFGGKDRNCTSSSCLNRYCSTDSDCGDSTMCCRSDRCVNKGCSGCRQSTDCNTSYVCCKKTSPLNQTICAVNCLNKTCNFNDDCGGYGECCRSGKCTDTGCSDKCTLNSECTQGQYCCKKKTGYYGYDSCARSCVSEICSRNEDCGSPNECCISNKCVDRGCSGCTTNSNCSTGQYCCKKRHSYELSECSDHCIGKSCNTNDDCGGPDETCHSDRTCKKVPLLPPWAVAVLKVSLVVLLFAIGVLLAVFWYRRRRRSTDTTHAETLLLHNTQFKETGSQKRRSNV